MHASSWNESEVGILQRARMGDAVAGEELFVKHLQTSGPIARLLRRALINPEDRKEMLHEIYMQLVCGQHEFRGDAQLSTYIYKVARITIFQKYRKENALKRRMLLTPLTETRDLAAGSESSPERVYFVQQDRMRISRMIEELPDAYRDVIRMRVFEEMSYQQIAGEMQLPINTVSTKIHKGKKLLLAACGS